jgi:hypothetical protein
MWSFYFMLMDFLNEPMPWRNSNDKDYVKETKIECFKNPETYLWNTTTKNLIPMRAIFYHLKSLEYADTPDYNFIEIKLQEMLLFF